MASLNLENKFYVEDASFIFDSKFHPDKDNIAIVSSIDGNVLM